MTKQPYQVGEGANLTLYPRGTKVGDVVHLTEGEAMYERDLGRLEPVVPGETKGFPADAVTGEALTLTADERAAIQALPAIGDGTELREAPGSGEVMTPVPMEPDGKGGATGTLTTPGKARGGR